MDYAQKKYWKILFFPDPEERKSPKAFIDDIKDFKVRSNIYNHLNVIEGIKIPDQWLSSKPLRYDGILFHQVTIGDYRVYICTDTDQGNRFAVVCHACLKVSQKAKNKDLERAAINIAKYVSPKGK